MASKYGAPGYFDGGGTFRPIFIPPENRGRTGPIRAKLGQWIVQWTRPITDEEEKRETSKPHMLDGMVLLLTIRIDPSRAAKATACKRFRDVRELLTLFPRQSIGHRLILSNAKGIAQEFAGGPK